MQNQFNNQIDQANFIKNKFSTYLRSSFHIRDDIYNDLYNKRLSELESKLYKGPFLSSSMPFEQSKSINCLIKDGVFEKDFIKVGGLDFDRPCYKHQIKAFERIKKGKSVVVTTGTGSGKTECFMLPIINELVSEIVNNSISSGVRAIFLFPLNALVYDQIDRLRSFLENYKDIKFGFYTGKTPESEKTSEGKKQINKYIQKFGKPSDNEVLTREKMRENPPHILFTNYSMLEYLLIRPTDEAIISKESLKNLKFIVLDEAHTYRGALGIEVSLLLRRLLSVAERRPQFVLTSATLGRGEEDLSEIIDFAKKLTSSEYEEEDVIFSVRKNNCEIQKYSIQPEDYYNLLLSFDTLEQFKEIYSKYRSYDENFSIKVNLFNLLNEDYNTYILYHRTKNVCDFYDTLKGMPGFSITILSSLIDLVSKSISSDDKYPIKLFDIKYHMFMKAPDGAFITVGKNKDLSLLTTNSINYQKAFKIGICQNCKTPYIMGITENNILCIDDEIDIDESYQDKAKRLEYYLIEDCLTIDEKQEIETNENFEKYYICSKCGYIKKAKSAVSSSDCEHLETNKTTLYKYIGKDEKELDDDDIVTNNINKCPVCDYRSNNGGVIMGFHVGKDRATTLISQILYESMNYPTKKIKVGKSFLLKSSYREVTLRKQFLAFSDSRQQAAFFSKFLNSNNDRFLKKTLLIQCLKENDYNSISFNNLKNKLQNIFCSKFQYSEEEAEKHAKAAALWELLLVDGRNSGEGLGLFAFKLNLNTGVYLNESLIEETLKENSFDITVQQFKDITSQVLAVFRTTPAINYGGISCNDPEEKKELLGYRQYDLTIRLQNTKKTKDGPVDDNKTRSFLPVEDFETKKSSVNSRVKYIMKALGYSADKAKNLLKMIFEVASYKENKDDVAILNYKYENDPEERYVIDANKYDLYSYKNIKFYKCNKCNKLTLYNVNDTCTEADCDGKLSECDVDNDEYFKNNYYRNEYINRPIEKLICKEHTAQLNADEAKDIQEDFKSETGKINFISCSTTFEMGIDLGGLNTIFMRNIPPTPANYAQRAGRAGRRAETSAFVLTFCGSSSHDYTYFSNPEEMIRGLVKAPYFVIDNDKILLRHITAAAFSLFFRQEEYKEDFGSVDHFISDNVPDKFISFINTKPQKLGDVVDKFILSTEELVQKYGNFKWIDYIDISKSALSSMKDGLNNLIKIYTEAMNYFSSIHDFSTAGSYKEALRRMNTSNSLITYFTKYNVIPGYGFPVDNVELHIYNHEEQEMNDDYNLSRNLSVAISEYAPGSEIIVDDRKYTSRYLLLPHNGYSLPTTYYVECEKCHTINTNVDKSYFSSGCSCKYCSAPLNTSSSNLKYYITPIYGFVADRNNKNTRRIKPFKTYASDIYYIGDDLSKSEELNNIVEISEHKNEELLVLNENNFYYCPQCGYTELDKKCMLPSKSPEKAHHEYNGKECKCGNKLVLSHLGYSYSTDIINILFNNISEMFDEETSISVLFAILEGISMTYNIERNDIGGIIYKTNIAKPYSLILFDTVPGGAGHVKRLKDDNDLFNVLKNALKKVSQECCDEGTSCYNCLRTYNNQKMHKHIKRGLAKNALIKIINKIMISNKKYFLSKPSIDFKTIEMEDFLKGPYIEEETSKNIFNDLIYEIDVMNASKPDGYEYSITNDKDKNIIFCDFVWSKNKILLFTLDNLKYYNELKDSQNEYECFLLSESFNCIDFVKKIRDGE